MSLFFALPFNALFLQVDYTECEIIKIQYSNHSDGSSVHSSASAPLPKMGQRIIHQIEQYFNHPQTAFSLSCRISQGTPFQQKVWQALRQIPSGEVKTYGTLARELGSSPRAIGNACRHNLFPLVIPCHRVVSATGIGGYAGDTLQNRKGAMDFMRIKQWLLDYEQKTQQRHNG